MRNTYSKRGSIGLSSLKPGAIYLEGYGFSSCWCEGSVLFFNHFFIHTVSSQIRALGVCFKYLWLVMHQSIPGAPMPPLGQRQLKGLKARSVYKNRNANAYPHDHHVQWTFYENFSVISQIENLWMDKIASKTFTSIQENWGGRNFITASRVNLQLIMHARMQRWIWNLQGTLDCNKDINNTTTYNYSFYYCFVAC